MPNVLQDWVMNISLRQQGVLILALRGPDGVAKEDVAKPIVRALRALVMVSGREGKPMDKGVVWRDDPFMQTVLIGADFEDPWKGATNTFYGSIDQYNVHFLQHLWHAFAIAGIHFPDETIRKRCWNFYLRGMRALHVHPETPKEIVHRLRDGERDKDL